MIFYASEKLQNFKNKQFKVAKHQSWMRMVHLAQLEWKFLFSFIFYLDSALSFFEADLAEWQWLKRLSFCLYIDKSIIWRGLPPKISYIFGKSPQDSISFSWAVSFIHSQSLILEDEELHLAFAQDSASR